MINVIEESLRGQKIAAEENRKAQTKAEDVEYLHPWKESEEGAYDQRFDTDETWDEQYNKHK